MNLRRIDFVFFASISCILSACQVEKSDTAQLCQFDSPVGSFEQAENLEINSPDDFGGTIRSSFIFQDTLIYLLADKPKLEVKIVDLKNHRFIGGVPLDPNFIDFPSGIQVHSTDSIFVSDFNFPTIRFDQ